jgi:3alpha(or 20beta)-hydroxysteroid dehydrogenase
MARLEGKVALVTGAARGMVASHARLFIREGAKVILTDVIENAGAELADELGPNATFLKHDVADPESWRSVIEDGTSAFGPITVLVNNAGIVGPTELTADLAVPDYLRVIEVDQHGVFYGMRAAIPGMIAAGGGSIINISSIAGFAHVEGVSNLAYTGAKFAVRGMTKATAIEYAARGIRVNSVHPGSVLTPLMEEKQTKEFIAELAETVPIKRLASGHDVALAVLFLASDDSAYVTGTELVVDGGMLAH